MTKQYNPTRRSALSLMGASAIATLSGPAFAATAPSLKTEDIALNWPLYHRLASFEARPAYGETLSLKPDARHPAGGTGIAVYRANGEKLGYVEASKAARLKARLDQGERLEARLGAMPTVRERGKRIRGWAGLRIDVALAA